MFIQKNINIPAVFIYNHTLSQNHHHLLLFITRKNII